MQVNNRFTVIDDSLPNRDNHLVRCRICGKKASRGELDEKHTTSQLRGGRTVCNGL